MSIRKITDSHSTKAISEIRENKFAVSGYFISGKRSTYVDFTANTKGKDISRLYPHSSLCDTNLHSQVRKAAVAIA
jgi:hypothetical protein